MPATNSENFPYQRVTHIIVFHPEMYPFLTLARPKRFWKAQDFRKLKRDNKT